MKGFALITIALFIDGIQAALSAALFIITAFPGTLGGAAAGCLAGEALAGEVGCSIGGFLLGLVGSFPLINGVLATATIPVGVALGFVISICISMTFGAGLIMLLILMRMFYPQYIFSGGIIELLPGFGLIPTWTALTILCTVKKSSEKGGVVGAVAAVASASSPAQAAAVTVNRGMDGIRGPAANDNNPPTAQRYAA